MPKKLTTPEEFAEQMLDIQKRCNGDLEDMHIRMDYYMTTVLEELGYEEGVKIFRETPKWYA